MKLNNYNILVGCNYKVESFEEVMESKVNMKRMGNVFKVVRHASE